jgi:tetratricopeptide (TPR) repeat protein
MGLAEQNTITEMTPEMLDLRARVDKLRAQPAPSIELIDALNAHAQALSRSDVGKALSISKEAYTLARLLHHHNGVAVSLARLSWLHLSDGLFDAAVIEAHEARFLAEQLNDYVLTTRAIYVLAIAERMAGNLSRSEALWRELLSSAKAQNDHAREADYLNELGVLFEHSSNFPKALAHYQQAHDVHVAMNDSHHVADKNNIAGALSRLGRPDEALAWAERALAICDDDWQVWRATILHTTGVIHMRLNHLAQARKCFEESQSISLSSAGNKETGVDVLLDLGRLALIHNQLHEAISKFEDTVKLATEIKSLLQLREAHKMLNRLYISVHSNAMANAHHEAMLQLDNQLNTMRISRQVSMIRVQAELDLRRPLWLQELQQLKPSIR